MASILDLLKAKGLDTSKLTSQSSDESQDAKLAKLIDDTKSEDQDSVDKSDDDSDKVEKLPMKGDDKGPSLDELLKLPNNPQSSAPASTDSVSNPTGSPSLTLPPSPDSSEPADTDSAPQHIALDPSIFAGFQGDDQPFNELPSSTPKPNDTDSDDSDSDSDTTPSSKNQRLQNLINAQTGFTNNTVAGLSDAQEQARQQQNQNLLMRGLSNVAGGLIGTSLHAKAPDTTENSKFYDTADKLAQQGVTDFQAQGEQEKNDPDSAISQQAKAFAAPIMKKLGITMPENTSYASLEKLNPLLVKQADAQDAIAARHEDLALKYSTLAQAKKDAATKKASDSQDKALLSTQQLLESARGNPAAAQAEKDLYAAQKADSLFNRYKDPNQMNNAEVQLYATEIAKMASGGVPSIHELQGLNPATVPSQLSQIAQKYSNSPTAANAGDFLKRYKAYSDSLAQDAKNVIQDKYGRVIESRKAQLGPDNYDSLQANYVNRFGANNASKSALPTSPTTSSGKITVSDGTKTYQIDPSDLAHAQADGFQVVK